MNNSSQKSSKTVVGWLKKPSTIIELVAISGFIILVACLGHWFSNELTVLEHWMISLGDWAPLIYFCIYVIATLVPIPASALGIAAGFIFTYWEGLGILTLSKIAAACLAFYLARLLSKKIHHNYFNRYKKLADISEALKQDSLKIMLLVRLCPISFTLSNYFFASRGVRFIDYVLALPATVYGSIISVYYGNMAMHVAKIASHSTAESRVHDITLILGIAITLFVISFVTHLVRHTLDQYSGGTIGNSATSEKAKNG